MAVNFLQYPFKLSWRQQIPLHSPRKPCNTSNEKNRTTVPWDFFNYEYDYRQNWTTCSLATNCSKLWQNFRTKLECVIRFHEKNSNSTSTRCVLFIYKGMTFLSLFTLSNYKQFAYTVLLVLKSGWWWPIIFWKFLSLFGTCLSINFSWYPFSIYSRSFALVLTKI